MEPNGRPVVLSALLGWRMGSMLLGLGAAISVWGQEREAMPIEELFGGRDNLFMREEGGALSGVGSNAYGQLGDSAPVGYHYEPQLILQSGAAAAAAGDRHTLILMEDGSVRGMGRAEEGQLGPNAELDNPVPVPIVEEGVAAVHAGASSSYVVTEGGALWAFGSNAWGQLGDGTVMSREEPVEVFASGVKTVSTDGRTTFVAMEDGSLWGMGDNRTGLLGPFGGDRQTEPAKVIEGGVSSVFGYGNEAFYYIRVDGSLWRRDYRFGDELLMDSGVIDVALSLDGVWALKADGSVWAMGENQERRLGDGTALPRESFVPIHFGDVRDIAAFDFYGWFLRENGEIWGTGPDWTGDFGGGSLLSRELSAGKAAVSFEAPNLPPEARTDGVIVLEGQAAENGLVVLDGTQSRDDWQIVSWEWSWEGGVAEGRQVEVEVEPGITVFTLTVSDHLGLTDTAELRVSSSLANTFSNWLEVYFTAEERQGMGVDAPDLDPDGDGLANWFEWATGLDPTDPLSSLGMEIALEGEGGEFRIRLSRYTDASRISLWQSADTETWEPSASVAEVEGGGLLFDGLEAGLFYQIRPGP